MKTYDRDYFDRWYRHPTDRVSTRDGLERKVRLAVSVTEYILGRRIRSVLDIGCGEAPWYPGAAPACDATSATSASSRANTRVERFGESRNIRRGSLDELGTMRLPRNIDLIVCADVMQYVDTRGVERGLRAIRKLLGGVAYIETFTTEDAMEGDHDNWHERSADEYRRAVSRGAAHAVWSVLLPGTRVVQRIERLRDLLRRRR